MTEDEKPFGIFLFLFVLIFWIIMKMGQTTQIYENHHFDEILRTQLLNFYAWK